MKIATGRGLRALLRLAEIVGVSYFWIAAALVVAVMMVDMLTPNWP